MDIRQAPGRNSCALARLHLQYSVAVLAIYEHFKQRCERTHGRSWICHGCLWGRRNWAAGDAARTGRGRTCSSLRAASSRFSAAAATISRSCSAACCSPACAATPQSHTTTVASSLPFRLSSGSQWQLRSFLLVAPLFTWCTTGIVRLNLPITPWHLGSAGCSPVCPQTVIPCLKASKTRGMGGGRGVGWEGGGRREHSRSKKGWGEHLQVGDLVGVGLGQLPALPLPRPRLLLAVRQGALRPHVSDSYAEQGQDRVTDQLTVCR